MYVRYFGTNTIKLQVIYKTFLFKLINYSNARIRISHIVENNANAIVTYVLPFLCMVLRYNMIFSNLTTGRQGK